MTTTIQSWGSSLPLHYIPTPIRTFCLATRNFAIELISLLVYGLLSKYCEWVYPVNEKWHLAFDGNENRPPLIITHGLDSHPSHMMWLVHNLVAEGFNGKIYLYDERETQHLTSQDASERAAQVISEKLPHGQFQLLAHSRGGNVFAGVFTKMEERVASFQSMCAPLRGSKTNWMAGEPTRTHHSWNSPALQERIEVLDRNKSKCHFIAARWDDITLPSLESAIPVKAKGTVYNWGGHLAPPFSFQVARSIASNLK